RLWRARKASPRRLSSHGSSRRRRLPGREMAPLGLAAVAAPSPRGGERGRDRPRRREPRVGHANGAPPQLGNRQSEANGAVLRYPISATAAEKPLPHKGQESFPSWTSPVRPRSPALRKERLVAGLACTLR